MHIGHLHGEDLAMLLSLIGFTLGGLYKFTRIEFKIEKAISDLKSSMKEHISDHKLVNYQVKELQTKLEDHHRILKSNSLLKRESD
jgi:hypothetical protein